MIKFKSLEEIIDFAIGKEQEAADFYEELSKDVESEIVARELLKMKTEEEKHRDWLKSTPIAFVTDAEPKKINDLNIAQYLIPIEPTKDMTFQDAIAMAMQRELMSMRLYTQLSGMVSDSMIQKVFLNLAAEEGKHKFYFETLWDQYVLSEN